MDPVDPCVCIECGCVVRQLFCVESSAIRLSRCEQCLSVADKYVELDATLLLLDIVLLRCPAYRHLLFNTRASSSARLLMLSVVCVNFLVQLTYVRRLRPAKLEDQCMHFLLCVLIEHLCFVAVVLGLLWLFPARYVATRFSRSLYAAVAFPELGKICAILDCEPAVLVVLGCLLLALQHRSLVSACITCRPAQLLLILLAAALVRAALRLALNQQFGVWWLLL